MPQARKTRKITAVIVAGLLSCLLVGYYEWNNVTQLRIDCSSVLAVEVPAYIITKRELPRTLDDLVKDSSVSARLQESNSAALHRLSPTTIEISARGLFTHLKMSRSYVVPTR